MESKIKCFDGTGDVKVFIEKSQIHSSLKGYSGEKAAQNLASRLEGRAFDVYMRMGTEERKDPKKITGELLKEFERGKQDREAAIAELNCRKRKQDESPQTFVYKLLELVKLAYPSCEDAAIKTITKDYFVNGLHPKMQTALKSLPDFVDLSVEKLAGEVSRLQLAGIQSFASTNPHECFAIENNSVVDLIAEKVIRKLKETSLECSGGQDREEKLPEANFVGNRFNRGRGGRNQRYFGRQNWRKNSNSPISSYNQQQKKCRTCQSSDHFFRQCPNRFCQACGGLGHDAWDKACPKYQ